jgi:hypothetical protein
MLKRLKEALFGRLKKFLSGKRIEELFLKQLVQEIYHNDPEIRQALNDKVKALILKEIGNIDSLAEIDDRFFSYHFPKDFDLVRVIQNIFQTDHELMNQLKDKARELVKQELSGMDASFFPQNFWDNLLESQAEALAKDRSFVESLKKSFASVLLGGEKHPFEKN